MTTAVVNYDSLLGRRVGAPPLTSAVISWNGLTGNVKGTLDEIWAFGSSDVPLGDNLFGFDTGNYRFVGSAISGQVPAVAFFESATTPGDQRVGTDIARRYFRVGTHVGSFATDEYIGFDPLWDGTFGPLDGLEVIAQRIGFSDGTGLQNTPGLGLVLGETRWRSNAGFFNGPDAWPLVGFNSGNREDFDLWLYNHADLAANVRHSLNGWGQYIQLPEVLEHGITAAFDSQVTWRMTPQADDGLGWFVRDGTQDPPLAILNAYLVSNGSVDLGWGWKMWGRDAAGSIGAQPMFSIDWKNGATFNVPVGFFAGATAQQLFQSPTLDMTAVQSVTLIPPVGYRLLLQNVGFVCLTANACTVSPTVQMDAGATNLVPSQCPAFFTTITPNTRNIGFTLASPSPCPDISSSAVVFQVTTGATATALTGRFFLTGALLPL
jgi:hypothetical protein